MKLRLDIVELLSNKELIAGLEINDEFLRLLVLDRSKEGNVYVRAVAEEQLKTGTVLNGNLKDADSFAESLKNLIHSAGVKFKQIIVSIPDINVYSKVFSFPKAITGEKLNEAMKVAAGFNLPRSISDVYLDWETMPSNKNNELLLATIPKETVDPYLKVFKDAGLNPIAFEAHILSAIRLLKLPDSPTMIVVKGKSSTEFVIVKGKNVRFMHFVHEALNKQDLDKDIMKISNFYEVEDSEVKKIINYSELSIPNKFTDDPRLKEGGINWLVSLGAALRGLLPRSQDTLISLMPIGTEAEYETQKEEVFSKFISDMMGGVALVFALGFIAVWALMLSIQTQVTNEPSVPPLPQNAVTSEAKAIKLNALVNSLNGIVEQMPIWSNLFDAFLAKVPGGIAITSFNVSDFGQNIAINGVARTRTDLNNFRRGLEESPIFSGVQFPLSFLDKATDIPFSATMSLTDKKILLPKK